MIGIRTYKTYFNLPNVLIRVSDGTERGKEHAVLINSHVDSTVPSPGAGMSALRLALDDTDDSFSS